MTATRRHFLHTAAVAGGGLSLGLLGCSGRGTGEVRRARNPLRILILGGTGFIGPHQVEYALKRGHTLTLFNRGRTNPHLFPDVEKLRGDRVTGELDALRGREWDVVIDNPATVPRWIREAAGILKDVTKQYVHVSTLSVYSDNSIIGLDESGPLATVEDPTAEEVTGATYGGLKVLCEQEAEKAYPGRATVVRPGLIVGPGDTSDRFTYWPARIDRGGEVLAPGNPSDVVQIIDARDLAEWMIHIVEESIYGIFNATGPEEPLPMGEMLTGIRDAISSEATFTWVDYEFLQQHRVMPWSHMPVWFPPTEEMKGFSRFDCSRALSEGLKFRPLAETARDTLAWHKTRPEEVRTNMRAGLPAERETEVLEAWHGRGGR